MKATELRLGNLIYGINRRSEVHLPETMPLKVLQIELFNCEVFPFDKNPAQEEKWVKISNSDITGIPLTEEWLKKFDYQFHSSFTQFGIKQDRWMIVGRQFGSVYIWTRLDGKKEIKFNAGQHDWVTLKYVHQLQNLFFCLCGEELTKAE